MYTEIGHVVDHPGIHAPEQAELSRWTSTPVLTSYALAFCSMNAHRSTPITGADEFSAVLQRYCGSSRKRTPKPSTG